MDRELLIEPDLQFTKDLLAAGGGDLKKCYQCATCSVACRIAPDNNPYPRKEMIWAQWGLRDRLVNDPDIWLCHQCNDCSVQCPRGANPSDVLKAIRKMGVQENAWPPFLGKLVGTPSLILLTIAIPIVTILALISSNNGFTFPQPVHYGRFIQYAHLQLVFVTVMLFAVISMSISLKNYWASLTENNPIPAEDRRKAFVPSLIEALKEVLPHTIFKECEANNIQYTAHLLVFWGMVGLFLTTTFVAFNMDILHIAPPSRSGPGTLPIKVLGNISAALFLLGLGIMLVRRLINPGETGNSSYFDWFFLLTIFGTGVTGVLTELIRLAGGSAPGAYIMFTVHLTFVLTLLLYLPFSKFAHIGYRTVAIAWAKSVGREINLSVQSNRDPSAAEAETAIYKAS